MSFQHFRIGQMTAVAPDVQTMPTYTTSDPNSSTFSSPTVTIYTKTQVTKGSYGSGDGDDGYSLSFPNLEAFYKWRTQEEEALVIEFVKGDTHGSKAMPPRFKEHTKLVCARHSRSGRAKYIKKHPERVRKTPSRKIDGTGCAASISFKTYFDTDEVRACYNNVHSHEIGPANLQYTRRGRKAIADNASRNTPRRPRKSLSSSDSSSPPSMPTFTSNPAIDFPQTQSQPNSQPQPPDLGLVGIDPKQLQQHSPQQFEQQQQLPPKIYPNVEANYPVLTVDVNSGDVASRWVRLQLLFNTLHDGTAMFQYPVQSLDRLEALLYQMHYDRSPLPGMVAASVAPGNIDGSRIGNGASSTHLNPNIDQTLDGLTGSHTNIIDRSSEPE